MKTDELLKTLVNMPPEEGLNYLANIYKGAVCFSSSLGQEDQVLTDMIFKNNLDIEVFTLDTGRLFTQTYELLERTLVKYKKPIKIYFPDKEDVEQLTSKKGPNSFYQSVDNRKECCHIRKVKPLKRALEGKKIWVTGLRAEQSANRQDMKPVEWDETNKIIKYNPLLNWSLDEVQVYINTHSVPDNSLHRQGFISIGCAPCTRAIEPGEDPRAGRWWWETTKKECGLHDLQPKIITA